MPGRILMVDDEKEMCELVSDELEHRGWACRWTTDANEALSILEQEEVDVLITDLNLAGLDGLEVCRRVVDQRPEIPVVVITGFGSLESAVGAIRAGAYDYITKPFEMDALALTVERAIRLRGLEREVRRLREVIEDGRRFRGIIGESHAIRRVQEMIARIAVSDATVLVAGESGTGKELVARALHEESDRRGKKFVAVNCAAVPATLLESELFGHVAGAFTDARTAKRGLFLEAEGGTLFLDEIGEMPAEMQVKLLRSLQEHRVRPLGSSEEHPFTARIVAATNRDLDTMVEEGRFRQDLFYRINVIRIDVPPLRDRGNDILLIAQTFIRDIAQRSGKAVQGISAQAAAKLLSYDWPGNVRELRNCMERAVALTQFREIAIEDLPDRVRNHQIETLTLPTSAPSELLSMEEVERRYIAKVLAACGGNKTAAAKILGFDRRTLYRKLERNGETAAEEVM